MKLLASCFRKRFFIIIGLFRYSHQYSHRHYIEGKGEDMPPLHGAEIKTYNDHRIAMSFAVAGLAVPGVKVLGEQCVAKSFPDFWDRFALLYK